MCLLVPPREYVVGGTKEGAMLEDRPREEEVSDVFDHYCFRHTTAPRESTAVVYVRSRRKLSLYFYTCNFS